MTATIAQGGSNDWTRLGTDGGIMTCLAIDPSSPTTLWAAGGGTGDPNAGVFKSTDSGLDWVQVFFHSVSGIAVHPATPDVALVVDRYQQVWKTADGGTSWTENSAGLSSLAWPGLHVMLFKPGDPNAVFLARTDGLYQSTDGGANWSPIGGTALNGKIVSELFFDPANPATLWVRVRGTDNPTGILKSTDGGTTWNPANGIPDTSTVLPVGGTGHVPLSAFAADPLAPATMYVISGVDRNIYKSTDGGDSWIQITSVPPPIMPIGWEPSGLLVAPGQSNVLWAGGGDPTTHSYHLYKSTDSGLTWNNVTGTRWTSLPAPLAIPTGSPSTIYASLADGLYATSDAGAAWHAINNGLHAFQLDDLAIDPTTPSTWYIWGSQSGIYKTVDSGATFSAINHNLVDLWGDGVIAVDPTNPQILYATGQTSQGWDATDYFHAFVRSADGGTTWQQVANPANDGTDLQVWGIAVVPTVPTTVFVSAPYDGVFKSTDGGITFNPARGGLPVCPAPYDECPALPTGVADYPYWGSIVATGTTGSDMLVANVRYAGDNPYRTADGGATWVPTTGMPTGTTTSTLAVDPSNLQTVYAGTNDGVYKSTDGGASWNQASTGLPAKPANAVASITVDPSSPNTLYASLKSIKFGGIGTAYRSIDGAASWSQLNNNGFALQPASALRVDPANSQHLIAAGRGGLEEITFDATDPLAKGVSSGIESQVPSLGGSGTGDGNGDGIQDTTQANVASLPTSTGSGYFTVAAPDDSGVSLFGVETLSSLAAASAPASMTLAATTMAAAGPSGSSFPDGLVQFSVADVPAGGCVAVTLYFPLNSAIHDYFDYGPTIDNTAPHWYNFAYDGKTGAEIFRDRTRTRIVLHLCDGLRGDGDVMANGVITNRGGPVVRGRRPRQTIE